MRKTIITLSIILVIIVLLYFLIKPIVFFVNKFHELDNLETIDTPYSLPNKFVVVVNIETGKSDTINFNGVKIINFWASWCKPCIEEQPSLEKLQKMNTKVNIIQFSFDSLKNQKKLKDRLQWTLPSYFISDTSIFKLPKVLPKTLILKDNIVLKEIYGAQNWSDSSYVSLIDSLSR